MKIFEQIRRRIVFMALDRTTGGTLKLVSVTAICSVRMLDRDSGVELSRATLDG
jgi:hypothetical protein